MYIREGECNQCGKCCETPTPERLKAYADAGREVTTQYVDGCPFEARTADGRIYCTDYKHRNQMCKDFPSSPVDIITLPNCGFRFKEGKH